MRCSMAGDKGPLSGDGPIEPSAPLRPTPFPACPTSAAHTLLGPEQAWVPSTEGLTGCLARSAPPASQPQHLNWIMSHSRLEPRGCPMPTGTKAVLLGPLGR